MKSRREDLIDTALRLFYKGGYTATGIDKILAEAGVAKMTLYKHFPSKDDLILAVLERRDEQFRGWLFAEMEKAGPDPRAQLLALFDALERWFKGEAFKQLGFNGCAFIHAAGEFGDLKHPAHQIAAAHKKRVVDHLETLCREAGAKDPQALAEQLALLKEGAIATAHVRGQPQSAQTAKAIAQTLIEAGCDRGSVH